MLKRMMSTLAALFVAGVVILGVVMFLAQESWNVNPLREQMAKAAEATHPDPWVLSEDERETISQVLEGVVYTDTETGQIKWVGTGGLDGWTVREPLRDYEYTGTVLVQRPRWYYPVCYEGTLYVVITAKAQSLPEGSSPVPPASDCVWTWELVRDESGQDYQGWYSLRMAYDWGDNDFAVINTEDYALLYSDGASCGVAMWENAIHTEAGDDSGFSFSDPRLFDNVVTADGSNEYPLA